MKMRMSEQEAEKLGWFEAIIFLLALLAILYAVFKPGKANGAAASENVVADSFIVSGYADGQFAIRGEPEITLSKGIAKVKNKIESLPGDSQIQAVIIGSADKTGTGNDELARKRAEQVKAVLLANFPEAKVVAWSRGDADNIKRVKVDYKIIYKFALASTSQTEPRNKIFKWMVIVGISMVIIAGAFLFFTKIQSEREIRQEDAQKWMRVWANEEAYSVKVFYDFEQKKIISPFKTRAGFVISEPINMSKRLERSLRGCLTKAEFKEQKEELIKRGIIKII